MLNKKYIVIGIILIIASIIVSLWLFPEWGTNKRLFFVLVITAIVGVVNFIAIFRQAFEKQQLEQSKIETRSTTQDTPHVEVPNYRRGIHHAEIIIGNSESQNVVKSLYDYLRPNRLFDENNVQIFTKGGRYHQPDENEITSERFVIYGEKRVAPNGVILGKTEGDFTISISELPEMFFITVIRGGKDTTQVNFDTDDKDVFSLVAKSVLKKIQELFTVIIVKGLPQNAFDKEQEKETRRKTSKRK
jgi:hypothetical protein